MLTLPPVSCCPVCSTRGRQLACSAGGRGYTRGYESLRGHWIQEYQAQARIHTRHGKSLWGPEPDQSVRKGYTTNTVRDSIGSNTKFQAGPLCNFLLKLRCSTTLFAQERNWPSLRDTWLELTFETAKR
eukprot:507006-Hanusia_phi.AAC.3